MTRLAELYNSKDFGGARKYCDELFNRYLRLFKPTGLFTEGHIKNKFFDRIADKYFYDEDVDNWRKPKNPKVNILRVLGFNDLGEVMTWGPHDDEPDFNGFIDKYWQLLFPQRDFEKGSFDFLYSDHFARGCLYREVAMIEGKNVIVKKSNAKAFKKLCKELERINPVLPGSYWCYKADKIN
jgi:hypothetical protein